MRRARAIHRLGAFFLLFAMVTPVRGDGGGVRVSRQAGPYLVTVFTTPMPLRAGRADVSVLVQDPETGEPAGDLEVHVHLESPDDERPSKSYPATRRQATNKLLRATSVRFPSPGKWTIAVTAKGTAGESQVQFIAEVLGAPPPWRDRLPWIAWPLLPIGLFALREILEHLNASGTRKRPAHLR